MNSTCAFGQGDVQVIAVDLERLGFAAQARPLGPHQAVFRPVQASVAAHAPHPYTATVDDNQLRAPATACQLRPPSVLTTTPFPVAATAR